MSNNLTEGTLLIPDNDLSSINYALAEIQRRIDELKGLRGRTTIHDRVGVSDPTDASDAVSLGVLQAGTAFSHITFLAQAGVELLALQPGTTYVELSEFLRAQVNFASPQGIEARVIVQGRGTEAGTGKGVAITQSDGTVIAEVTWDDVTDGLQLGEFTTVDLDEDQVVQIRVKGSTATESLLLRGIVLDLRYSISVVTV